MLLLFCQLEANIYYVHPFFRLYGKKEESSNIADESVVTPSGNSGHVVVPKAWIGKKAIVKLKEKETRGTKKK
jgi:putative transposon-encoded protein